jgi:hypothetical protein
MGRSSEAKPANEVGQPTSSKATSEKPRQWRELQVVELEDVFRVHPPIGKPAQDGQMKLGGSKIAIWEPIAAALNKRLPEVNRILLERKPEDRGKLKENVTAECKTKFDAMQKEYRKACSCVPNYRMLVLSVCSQICVPELCICAFS